MTAPCGSVTTVTPGLWYGRHVAVLSTCGGTMPEPKSEPTKKLFNTRSSSWREAGLARQLSRRAVKRARIQAIVTVPLLAGILIVYGAFTAVIVGLAAQQTLGNLIAGTVLLSARPFRVGERVRLQGGGIAGQIEGVVSSLGLLYTTFAQGADHVMVPNSVVLNVAIVPLREPDGVDLRARLAAGVTPLDMQELLETEIETPVRDRPQIMLEEIDGDEVVVRISATPENPSDGPRLATEVLEAVAAQTARVDGCAS